MKLLSPSRPPGYAARGTSTGLLGLVGLLALVPTVTMISLFPVYTSGIDLMLAGLPYIVGNGLVYIFILTLGLHKRRLWYIYFIFVSGCLLLALYVMGALFNLGILLRMVPLQEPVLYPVSYYIVFCWLVAGVLAWWTLRMIRLRYWQPWTTAEQWEPGDETGPRWAQRMRERRQQP